MAEGNARVYVHNLSWDLSEEELNAHFSTAGAVKAATIMRRHDGKSKGCAIVEFGSQEEAHNAMNTLNDTDLKGRNILVREDREAAGGAAPDAPRPARAARGGRGGARGGAAPRAPRAEAAAAGPVEGNGTAVFVGNLAWATTWTDLKDAFAPHGAARADVMKTAEGRSKGFGIVKFNTPEEAQAAIAAMNGSEVQGRNIEVRLDRGRPVRATAGEA